MYNPFDWLAYKRYLAACLAHFADATLRREIRLGSIKPLDAPLLADLLRRQRPRRVLEIGSFVGISTGWIHRVAARQRQEVEMVCVDPGVHHRGIVDLEGCRRTILGEGVYRTIDWRQGYWGGRHGADAITVADVGGGFDFAWVDGDHGYDAVADDFATALPCMAAGGIVAFHDARSWEGVHRFCAERGIAQRGPLAAGLTRLIGKPLDGVAAVRLDPGR